MHGSYVRELIFFGAPNIGGRLEFSQSAVLGEQPEVPPVTFYRKEPKQVPPKVAKPKSQRNGRAYSRTHKIVQCDHDYPEGTLVKADAYRGLVRYRCKHCDRILTQEQVDRGEA
jgi:hypothetical protein